MEIFNKSKGTFVSVDTGFDQSKGRLSTYLLQPSCDNVSAFIKHKKEWKDHLINFAKHFINEKSTVIDVGASIGVWSIELSRYCKKILAFEPNRRSFNLMGGNLFLNEVFNVDLYPLSLSDSNMPTILISDPSDFGSSSLVDNIDDVHFISSDIKDNIKNSTDTEFLSNYPFVNEVTQISFDRNFPQINNVRLIKIFAPGVEEKIITGMERLIKNNRPVIIFTILWKKDRASIIRILDRMNYETYYWGDAYTGRFTHEILPSIEMNNPLCLDFIAIHSKDQDSRKIVKDRGLMMVSPTYILVK